MRRRLVLAIAGVATTAVVALAIPLGIVLSRNYRDERLLRLQRDAIAATRTIDLQRGGGDPRELPSTAGALGVYDLTGRLVAGRGPAAAPAVVRVALRTRRPADATGAGRLVVAVPVLRGERVVGAVRAERADGAAARDARDAWLVLAATSAAIILAGVLAALGLGRHLAAPLERLAGSARRLGHGDFSARAPSTGIAELDEVGAALDATAARLGDLVARERAFSADASHQLRTPLQALRIELEAIGLRGVPPPELPAALAQVDRLQETVDTLLAVARDAPRGEEVSDLDRLVAEVEPRWRGALAAQGRPLRVISEPGLHAVRASVPVVREILDVLVDNAGRHGAGQVTIALREVEPFVAVDVEDEGPGFALDPEEALGRRRGKGDGHGIGLALARSLAHAEGGRLEVARGGRRPLVRLVLPGAGDEVPSGR